MSDSVPGSVTLLVTENFPPKTGGSGRWFWELYRRLPRDRYLIAAGEGPRQQEFDETHELNVRRVPLRFRSWGIAGWRDYRRALGRLRPIVAEYGIDQVHCGRCLPEGLLALFLQRRFGIPFICYVHGEELNYASASRELRWLARRVLCRAEFVIANSGNTIDLLKSGWGLPEEKIRLLHPGVDCTKFRPAPRDNDVRRRLGWNNRPVVLTVGRLQRRKGQDQMILAVKKIRESIPDVLYSIVGEGEERPRLERLVRENHLEGNVHFVGEPHDEKLVQCYQQCDLFVLANRQDGQDIEGFGMVLVEAQACGKPVIAGRSGGTAETMRVGETGFVIPCETPDGLASLIPELLSDPPRLERMGQSARQWVAEVFDWERVCYRADQLFRSGAVGRRHREPATSAGRAR